VHIRGARDVPVRYCAHVFRGQGRVHEGESEKRQVCTEGDCGGCLVGWVGLCGCLTRDSCVKEKLGCVCTVCTEGWRRVGVQEETVV
jgi:hypothetical protein